MAESAFLYADIPSPILSDEIVGEGGKRSRGQVGALCTICRPQTAQADNVFHLGSKAGLGATYVGDRGQCFSLLSLPQVVY